VVNGEAHEVSTKGREGWLSTRAITLSSTISASAKLSWIDWLHVALQSLCQPIEQLRVLLDCVLHRCPKRWPHPHAAKMLNQGIVDEL
jgi:hypothetical protein